MFECQSQAVETSEVAPVAVESSTQHKIDTSRCCRGCRCNENLSVKNPIPDDVAGAAVVILSYLCAEIDSTNLPLCLDAGDKWSKNKKLCRSLLTSATRHKTDTGRMLQGLQM